MCRGNPAWLPLMSRIRGRHAGLPLRLVARGTQGLPLRLVARGRHAGLPLRLVARGRHAGLPLLALLVGGLRGVGLGLHA
jgi:hypothetical protein